MEKISYDEVRSWFWVRSWIWSVPAIIISAIAHFAYLEDVFQNPEQRVIVAMISGALTVLFSLVAAIISIQTPWMRKGWRVGFLFNGIACGLIAAAITIFIAGFAYAYASRFNESLKPIGPVNAIHSASQFAAAIAALWGFIYGTWFALRRDRYFVESI